MKNSRMRLLSTILFIAVACLAMKPQQIGPVDGRELSATDLERLKIGSAAPDFVLTDLEGKPVQLSRFRNNANVVLVFYRGYW